MNKIELEKYPAYKDSGVEWLGEIPEHWEVRRTKSIIESECNGVWGKDPDENSDTYCIRVADFNRNTLTVDTNNLTLRNINGSDFTNRSLVPGDLLIEKSGGGERTLVGQVVLFAHRIKAVSSNFVSRIRLKQGFANNYINYLFSSLYNNGINFKHIKQTTGIQNLDTTSYFNERIALPPIEEQTAIADFLDRKTAQIDKAIAQKEKLIDLLKERRQILIHKAVTRGLDPNVQMKDSGVEWIGEIPEHWEVKKLKYFSVVQSGLTLGKTYLSKNLKQYPYLRVANVQLGYFDLTEITEIKLPCTEAGKYLIKSGDILVTEGGDLDKLGRGTVWKGEISNCLHQNHIFAIRVDSSVATSEFVAKVLESDIGRKYFTTTANKTTNLASTNSTKLKNTPIPLPGIDEQKRIIEFIEVTGTRIAQVIVYKEKEIEKLKEYKATLINAAVTGKIKVG